MSNNQSKNDKKSVKISLQHDGIVDKLAIKLIKITQKQKSVFSQGSNGFFHLIDLPLERSRHIKLLSNIAIHVEHKETTTVNSLEYIECSRNNHLGGLFADDATKGRDTSLKT